MLGRHEFEKDIFPDDEEEDEEYIKEADYTTAEEILRCFNIKYSQNESEASVESIEKLPRMG